MFPQKNKKNWIGGWVILGSDQSEFFFFKLDKTLNITINNFFLVEKYMIVYEG